MSPPYSHPILNIVSCPHLDIQGEQCYHRQLVAPSPPCDGCVHHHLVMAVSTTTLWWLCPPPPCDGCVHHHRVMAVSTTTVWWLCPPPLCDGCVHHHCVMAVSTSPLWWLCPPPPCDGCVHLHLVMAVSNPTLWWLCLLPYDGFIQYHCVMAVSPLPPIAALNCTVLLGRWRCWTGFFQNSKLVVTVCLLFCQMTQCMTILEDYFNWKG